MANSQPKQFMHLLRTLINQNRSNEIGTLILSYPRGKELALCLDHQGKNVFFRAIQILDEQHCLRTLQHLVRLGGDPKHKDINKQTIMHFATRYQKQQVVKYLLTFNYSLNDDDFCMQTPLFYSAKFNKNTKITEMLLRAGCDPNKKDSNLQTCIFYAAGYGNLQIVKLLVQYGANAQQIDKNRQKPSTYARKSGYQHIIDYLNNCKHQVRRIKQDRVRNVQESSQNTVEPRKKKETTRNQYALVYTNENGQSKVLSYQEVLRFADTSEENEKLYRMMIEPQQPVQGLGPIPDKKFQRIALKILSYFGRLENSFHFHEPVNYIALNLFDYPKIVKYPMDFSTIKRKLTLNAYENELEFQEDMNLVFDNCILYNGTELDIGKIALQMKMEFNATFVKEFSG